MSDEREEWVMCNEYDDGTPGGSAKLQLDPLPDSYEAFEEEAQKIPKGYKKGVSRLGKKISRDDEECPRVKILSFAYDSYTIRRCPYHTTMILLGESGVGKSSTVNHFFGRKLAATSSKQSETRETTEYVLKRDEPDLDVKDLSLGVIDTPGFRDTEGVIQDACNLACINAALKEHKPMQPLAPAKNRFWASLPLGMGDPPNCYPNVILIIAKATDNRYEGASSNFQRSLKAVKSMGLVDAERNNVVMALTNVMGRNHFNPRLWSSRLQKKADKFRAIAESILGVSPEVVLVENNFVIGGDDESEDEEDDEDGDDDGDAPHRLEQDGDFTVLPDGTRQIFNLYEAITRTLDRAGDSLGLQTFKTLFKRRYEGDVEISFSRRAVNVKNRERYGQKEMRMLALIEGGGIGDDTAGLIPLKINEWMVRNGVEMKVDEKMEAYRLKSILQSVDEEQLRTSTVDSLRMNLRDPTELTALHVRMLHEIFGVGEKKLQLPVASCLGRGFDIVRDDVMPLAVFNFKEGGAGVESDCGFRVPAGVSLQLCRETCTFMEQFADEEEYVRRRLSDLQVSLGGAGVIDPTAFNMRSRGGFTKASGEAGASSTREMSYLLEKRLFSLELEDPTDREALGFTKSFAKAIARLPQEYDRTNANCVREMQDFFNTWGQYVVVQAYAGGSIEIQSSSLRDDGSEEDVAVASLATKLELSNLLARGASGAGSREEAASGDQGSFFAGSSSVRCTGGDPKCQITSETGMESGALRRWEQSLALHPSVLTTNLRLVPIYELAEDEGRRRAMRDASDDLLRGKMGDDGSQCGEEREGGGGQRKRAGVGGQIWQGSTADASTREEAAARTTVTARNQCCIL